MSVRLPSILNFRFCTCMYVCMSVSSSANFPSHHSNTSSRSGTSVRRNSGRNFFSVKRVYCKTKTRAQVSLMHLRKRFHSDPFFICILMQLSVLHLPNYHSGSLWFSAVTLKGKTPNSKTFLFLLASKVVCF